MRSINDPRQTGKLDWLQKLGGRAFTAPDKVHCRAIVERFNFVLCCTTRAAVTKSPLDRLFFSRFEL
jgi:hypothetical protein